MKNRIILYTGCFNKKKRIDLYNFSSLKHVVVDGISYIRITCDGAQYFYKTMETSIGEIECYEI